VTSNISDVESQQTRRFPHNDPYNLSSALKTADQIKEIRANSSRKRDGASSSKAGPKAVRGRIQAGRVEHFYKNQNETIERLLKSVEEHRAEAAQTRDDDHLRLRIAVYGSFVANCILAILQLYGAIASGSLSLFTTMADSIFE
jgi:hypothetical protein